MLKWCSYCQQFLGEIPDYEKLTITHGVCAACAANALAFTESDFKLAESLRHIQHQLHDAGRRNVSGNSATYGLGGEAVQI
jgi:hypothetical protein